MLSIEFFDVFFSDFNEERKIDLNETKILFTKSCAADKFKDFFVKEITSVIPNSRADHLFASISLSFERTTKWR